MVRFGDQVHPRLSSLFPRPVSYRADQTTTGRTARLSGEIKAATLTGAALVIELLRRLADDIVRVLDLEDGETETFNAKLVDPQYTLAVEDHWFEGRYHVPYSVTFLQVA
jgi:hypothetical protein